MNNQYSIIEKYNIYANTNPDEIQKIVTVIAQELIEFLTQDNELNETEKILAHQKINILVQIRDVLQGKGWLSHDLNTLIGRVVRAEWFDTQRTIIQEDPELKELYKQEINSNIITINIVDHEGIIGEALTQLQSVHPAFFNTLDTSTFNTTLNNRQWQLYILGIAYNLYQNASKFSWENEDIHIILWAKNNQIIIESHSTSAEIFNEENKQKILSCTWVLESQEDKNHRKWQGIYLLDLAHILKDIHGEIQIASNPTQDGEFKTSIVISLPQDQIKSA